MNPNARLQTMISLRTSFKNQLLVEFASLGFQLASGTLSLSGQARFSGSRSSPQGLLHQGCSAKNLIPGWCGPQVCLGPPLSTLLQAFLGVCGLDFPGFLQVEFVAPEVCCTSASGTCASPPFPPPSCARFFLSLWASRASPHV